MDANRREIEAAIAVIGISDERYPPLLRHAPAAPPRLYVRGSTAALTAPRPMAIVGTRKMTRYGEAATRLLSEGLARAGLCVVSGLALGVDAVAHDAALRADGATVAVLASGVDAPTIGPRTNAPLGERIAAGNGALVSEHPPATSAAKFGFPRRNRIIAGMVRGVIVVEAAERSGALITARLALEAGRDVFAVPGPITSPASAGANRLLRDGAVPATSVEDILAYYDLSRPATMPIAGHTEAERRVLAAIMNGVSTPDAVAAATGMPLREIMDAATALLLAGTITDSGGRLSAN